MKVETDIQYKPKIKLQIGEGYRFVNDSVKEHNLNTNKVWDQILKDGGSVQGVKALDKVIPIIHSKN